MDLRNRDGHDCADGAVTLRDSGLIDTVRFLDGYASELAKVRADEIGQRHSSMRADAPLAAAGGGGSGGTGGQRMAEVLVSNHTQLLAIFRYLDTNGRCLRVP